MKSFEDSILRVLKGDSVVGAAFLVSDRLVATCAHVVKSAGTEVGGKISLRSSDGKKIEAIVEPEFWLDPDAEDVSILRLENRLDSIQPIILGSSSGTKGHNFSTSGFPKQGQELSGGGEIIGLATIDGIKLLQLRSPEVTPGFSGAPIFDEVTRRVVGMVVAIAPPDEYQRLGATAFAIPSKTIREICPELQISDIRPYRSLDVFNEEDALFFFGRERVVQKMIDSLKREPRFLAVLGPSGSGKSSVVRAGLIPALRQGKVPGSAKWGVITTRPANQPFEQLDNVGLSHSQDGLEKAVRFWLENHPQETCLELVIDQFEEVLISTPANIRQQFIAELAQLLEAPIAITVVLTLRDDFYSRFLHDAPTFADWLERGLVNTAPVLRQDELQAMIFEPAKLVGLSFDDGLVDLIIADACETNRSKGSARSTILPLLEFALTQLWEKREASKITHQAYNSIGGVTGSLTQWADRAYYSLNIEERHLAQRIFSELVLPGDENRNIPDVKQIKLMDEITGDVTSYSVVQHFVKARLLSTGYDKKLGKDVIEIIHDALLHQWEILKEWVAKDREFLLWREQLRNSIQQWERNFKSDDTLLNGFALSEAELWFQSRAKDLIGLEYTFITNSIELRLKRQGLNNLLSKLDYISSAEELYKEISKGINEILVSSKSSIYEYNYLQSSLILPYPANPNNITIIENLSNQLYKARGLSGLNRSILIINHYGNNDDLEIERVNFNQNTKGDFTNGLFSLTGGLVGIIRLKNAANFSAQDKNEFDDLVKSLNFHNRGISITSNMNIPESENLEPVWSLIAVPIINAERFFGIIAVTRSEKEMPFSGFDIQVVESVANRLSTLLVTVQMQDQRLKFLIGLAHEMNTPLTGILADTENLYSELPEKSELRKIAKHNMEQVMRLHLRTETIMSTVADTKRYADVNNQFSKHSISRPINDARKLFQSEAAFAGCDILKPIARGEPFPIVEMLPYELTNALKNIIHNAVKYSFMPSDNMKSRGFITIIGKPDEEYPKYYLISSDLTV